MIDITEIGRKNGLSQDKGGRRKDRTGDWPAPYIKLNLISLPPSPRSAPATGIRDGSHRLHCTVYVAVRSKRTKAEPDTAAGSCRNGLVDTRCAMEPGAYRDAIVVVKHFTHIFGV